MIIYIEKDLIDNLNARKIIDSYKDYTLIKIDNYKNIFDKNISWTTSKNIIIAKINNPISESPQWYWHEWRGYFFKNSLNCVYDCKYCYLKWAFKNDFIVYFVNYDNIKESIKKIDSDNSLDKVNWFYSSDYSDNLAVDNITWFTNEFIDFFWWLKNSKMEIRTKSINIKWLLNLKSNNNVEIAFSLNPNEIISKYELKTPSLDLRINAINKLLDKWWLVGIRFLPLLEVDNYKEIYSNFLDYIIKKIDFNKISSIFIWGLLYTKDDYNKILKKEPYLDLLYSLEDTNDWFVREKREVRDFFYRLFDEKITGKKCNRCLDE